MPESGIQVRKAHLQDAETIARFNRDMAIETEHLELDDNRVLNGVRRLLEKSQFGFYVVAEISGQIAGCLCITYEWTDWRDGIFWWIQSVYVLPSFRQQGVYRAMVEYIRSLARKDPDVRGFRLYVDRDNHRAQRVYEAMGMTKTNYLIFEELTEG